MKEYLPAILAFIIALFLYMSQFLILSRRKFDSTYYSGKTILITGAARGLGKQIVEEIVRALENESRLRQTTLILVDITEVLPAEISRSNVILRRYCTDLSNAIEVNSLLDSLEGVDVDILINNAGIRHAKKIDKLSIEEFELTFRINLFAHFRLIRHFLSKPGKLQIVGIHSVMSHLPAAFLSDYCSSKAASFMFYDVLRQEVDPERVSILSVCPYVIDTEMFKGAFEITRESSFVEKFRNALFPPLKKESVARQVLQSIMRKDSYLYLYPSLAYLPFLMRFFPTRLYNFCLVLGCGETSMRKIATK